MPLIILTPAFWNLSKLVCSFFKIHAHSWTSHTVWGLGNVKKSRWLPYLGFAGSFAYAESLGCLPFSCQYDTVDWCSVCEPLTGSDHCSNDQLQLWKSLLLSVEPYLPVCHIILHPIFSTYFAISHFFLTLFLQTFLFPTTTPHLCVGIDEVHPFSVSIQTLCNKTLNSHLPDNEVHTMGTATQPAGLHPCFTQQALLMIPILKQEQYYWTYPTNLTGMLQTVSHNDFNTVRRYLQYKLK